MEKLVVATLIYVNLAMILVRGTSDQWVNKVSKANEKVTHLRFYVQDVVTGPNPTVVTVAHGPGGNKSPFAFGNIMVIDDRLTNGPEPTSNSIGRVQGILGYSDLTLKSFIVNLNFVFTSGEFNGSSLTMMGRNEAVLPVREMAIVGGSGLFRLARGFATTKTLQFNLTTLNGVYEYNIVAIHY